MVFLKKIKEGATENSYGIHVAQLAGIPASVIKRAEEVLKSIQKEASTLVDFSGDEKEKSVSYPSLFSEEEMVLDEILSINPDDMTPMQALQSITRWKNQLLPQKN